MDGEAPEVPAEDRNVGMRAYSTPGRGAGGRLRAGPGDFEVREVLREGAAAAIREGGGRYAVYLLRKRGVDTAHALSEVRAATGMRLKALGLKDADASTVQYACATGRRAPTRPLFEAPGVRLERIGFAARPLSARDMLGNAFRIAVSGCRAREAASFAHFGRVLNFFGHRRFGSSRPVTHLVGRALVRGDFAGAVGLMLSFAPPGEGPERRRLRGMMADPARRAAALAALPRGMDLERTVLSGLVRHGDPRAAFAALPVAARRFYVQAYQSFLFNEALSSYWESEGASPGLLEPRDGDVCFGADGGLGRPGPAASAARHVPAVPTAGYAYYPKTRFDGAVSAALSREGVRHADFAVGGMPEIGAEGGFRAMRVRCSGAAVEEGGGGSACTARFTLGRGSFATVVMREIMKPGSPLSCGL